MLFYSEYCLEYFVKQSTFRCEILLEIKQYFFNIFKVEHEKLLSCERKLCFCIIYKYEMFFFINIVFETGTCLDNCGLHRYNENQFHIAKRWTKE